MTSRDGDQVTAYKKEQTPKGLTNTYDGTGSVGAIRDDVKPDPSITEMDKLVTEKAIEKKQIKDIPAKVPTTKDVDSASGMRQELVDSAEVGARLMTTFDKDSGVLKAAVQNAMRQTELAERAQQVNLIDYPLNDWRSESPLKTVPIRVVRNEIPHILELKRTSTQVMDQEVINVFAGQFGATCDIVRDSMAMFASNADRVTYVISSKGTTVPFDYDPESPSKPTLQLESFKVHGADGTTIEDADSRTEAFSGLLELILRIMKQGDVYIQSPKVMTVGDYEALDGPLNLLRGKNVPLGMLPHITFGSYAHTLPWFQRQVAEIVPQDEVIIGEYDGVEKCGASDAKKKSNYAVVTDHIYATLHQIFMQEHNQKRADAGTFRNSVASLMHPQSTLRVLGDTEVDLYEVYQPDHSDAHRYVFLFLMSPAIRDHQYNYICSLFRNMRGIRAITAADRLRTEQQPVDPFGQRSYIDEALIRTTRGYTIDHWYQMMTMEYAHRFIEPVSAPSTMFTTVQDAVFQLLAVAVDSLCFPNLFWTNIHIYSYVIYRAWQFLHPGEYANIIRQGYTRTIIRVTQLTKQQIRSGEIPRIFEPGAQLPQFMARFMRALEPVGELVNLQYGNQDWSPNIDNAAQFYVPFTFERRPKIGSVTDTPFSDQFNALIAILSEMTIAWGRNNGQSRNNTSPLLTTLSTLKVWSRVFGSIAHYEQNVLYTTVVNGPEIISTSYRGGRVVNRAPMIGVCSSVEVQAFGLSAIDRNHKLYFGIGLWGMMSLVGDQLSTAGTVERSIPTSFQFFDPQLRYVRFIDMLQQSKNFAEAFGLMTYFLDGHENPQNPMQFLVNVFGQSLKAGTANQILTWLLQDVDIKTVLYGKLASREAPFYVDQRLRAPRVCELGNASEALPFRQDQSEFYRLPLDLLNQFTLRKLEVAIHAIASENSPIHRYCQDLVVQRGIFNYYSPENRHEEPAIIFQYDPRDITSGFGMDGNETKVYFRIQDRNWYNVGEPGFPQRVRVEITNPAEVIQAHWDYLDLAIEFADWQIKFVGMNFLTRIRTVTHDVAKQLYQRNQMDWKFLQKASIGTVVPVTFYDTRSDLINNRTTVFPSGSIQYVCAEDRVERNVAVRGIIGLQQPYSYQAPERDMWTIGMRRSDDIPMTAAGVPKYALPTANFNNFVQIYTANAVLDGVPPLIFLPPRGEDI